MGREINLDGGEITLLKKIGLSGSQMLGKLLVDKMGDDEKTQFLETLVGLIDQDYVISNKVNIRRMEEVERAFFRVNPAYALELRDAVNPSRRRAREDESPPASIKPVGWLQRVLRLWPWLAAVLSGLLYAGCFAPFNQGWVCWFALTPLLAAVWFSGANSKRRWLRNLLLGYVAGFVFFAVVFSWLGSLGILFDNTFLRGLPAILAIYLGLYLAVWSWIAGWIRPPESQPATSAQDSTSKWNEMLARGAKSTELIPRSPWLKSWNNLLLAFTLAAVWVAFEWIRGWLFGGFGWNGLGVALHTNWPIIQIAEYTGVSGLSFLIAFANVIGVSTARRLILETRFHRMRPHYDLTLTMAAIIGLLAFGMHAMQSRPETERVRVTAVQPNISQREKFDPQFTPAILKKLGEMSEVAAQANPPPHLVVWPESALPEPFPSMSNSERYIAEFTAEKKVDLLVGAIELQEEAAYNSALLFSGSSQATQIYRKIHLVPFGEYVPLRHAFPPFGAIAGKWVPADFDFGKDYTLFPLSKEGVQVAPLICFEDTIGDLTRRFVLKGANLLVDITNDGWFLTSAGSSQHVANALFRCVETRRPMVRAANTGVTCFINEFGRITETLRDETGNTFGGGVLSGTAEVPTQKELTFYVQHGDLFAHGCTGIALLILGILAVRSRLRH